MKFPESFTSNHTENRIDVEDNDERTIFVWYKNIITVQIMKTKIRFSDRHLS